MHPPPPLEASLDAVLIGELWSHQRNEVDDTFVDIILDDPEGDDPDAGDGYYAAFEVVIEELAATTEFVRVRDTSHDQIVTVRFPRGTLEVEPAVAPRYSAPYERIELAESSGSSARSRPFPLYSVPFERVELGALPAATPAWSDAADESTEVLVPSSSPRAVRVLLAIAVIGGALALGLGLMRLALP